MPANYRSSKNEAWKIDANEGLNDPTPSSSEPSEVKTNASSWIYASVTPHNSTDFSTLCRAIYVGGTGNIVAVRQDGTAVTFNNVPAGSILPIACRRINATNTTATNIVALF